MPQVQQSDLFLFVYNEIKDNLDCTFEEWKEQVKNWELKPIYHHSGDLVAVVMINKNEIHVAIDQNYKGRWLTKGTIKRIFGDILKEYGSIVTCTTYGDKVAEKFVTRLGFVPDTITYVMEEVCQQE
jgi:hypothetical protein